MSVSTSAVHCPAIGQPVHTNASGYETVFGTILSFDCDFGFIFPDKSSRKTTKCQANKEWTTPIPPCESKYAISYSCSSERIM